MSNLDFRDGGVLWDSSERSKHSVYHQHPEGRFPANLVVTKLMGPSSIAVPVKGETLETPQTMTVKDIELWKVSFAKAADRAVLAGFDLMEFHSAHGYGLNQWLSPLTNQREDEYGRNLNGRSKILREVVGEVRKNHPTLLLSVRLPGQDFMEGGLTTSWRKFNGIKRTLLVCGMSLRTD